MPKAGIHTRRVCAYNKVSVFKRSCIMRKWILACAVVTVACIFAEQASAQGILGRLRSRRVSEPVVTQPATTTTQPSTTVQPSTTTTTATTQMQVMEQRRGLLGRLRPARQQVVTTTPEPIQAPKKMPGTTGTTGSGVVQAQATTPATTTMTTTSTMPVSEGRQGILSRIRSRLGR
jgi:hypothetical protein